jgi:c-di-GMP phosphodiesterase
VPIETTMAASLSSGSPTSAAGADDVVLLARQPIFESSWKVHGYELLFRRPDGRGWPFEDETAATAHVVVSAFADLGLGVVTGGAQAWINVPRDFLLQTDVTCILPRDRVVLELLERDEVDEPLLERVRALVDAGYRFALDDFVWSDATAPLVDLATYVKLDVQALGIKGVSEHVRLLAGRPVRLIAEKIETEAEFGACVRLGIGLHQGYHFERPRLLLGRPTPHQAISSLRALTGLGPDATFEDVEAFLRRDPGLSMRLLRFLSSASVGLRHRVGSLRQALALVGVTTVRQWLLLVMLSELGTARPELLRTGLVRARLCETIAPSQRARGEAAFLVGLLSITDALFDVELREVIDPLPLSDDVRDALLRRQGPLGRVLEQAITVQGGRPAGDGRDPRELYDALRWADEQIAALAAPLH